MIVSKQQLKDLKDSVAWGELLSQADAERETIRTKLEDTALTLDEVRVLQGQASAMDWMPNMLDTLIEHFEELEDEEDGSA